MGDIFAFISEPGFLKLACLDSLGRHTLPSGLHSAALSTAVITLAQGYVACTLGQAPSASLTTMARVDSDP